MWMLSLKRLAAGSAVLMLLAAHAISNAYASDGQIGLYTSPARSYSTASYWIEGPQGLVLIDTQFLPKEGIEAVQLAEKTTGKKVVAAIVLHPNPDKFNGTAVLQARGIRVITAAQVKTLIPAVHQIRLGWFFEDYKPDYPKDAAQPDVFGDKTQVLELAGLKLTAHVLGRGASGAHVVVQFNDHVFVGDLINPTNHAWLELGTITPWLDRLKEIAAMKPRKVYPGRGPIGGPELIEQQAQYLRQVQNWVREEKPSGQLGWLTKLRLQNKIERAYPTLGFPIFMRDGLAAVWEQEQGK